MPQHGQCMAHMALPQQAVLSFRRVCIHTYMYVQARGLVHVAVAAKQALSAPKCMLPQTTAPGAA